MSRLRLRFHSQIYYVIDLHKCCSMVASGNCNFCYAQNPRNTHNSNMPSPSVMGFMLLVEFEMEGVLVIVIDISVP